MRKVAALYIDPRGPYPKLEGVECWDEQRDARLYGGPHPVVAHPPCTNYGSLRHLAKRQDADCGPIAVEQVRKFGGVLEHPAGSKLWERMDLPLPMPSGGFEGFSCNGHSRGFTIEVEQVSWGHVARKKTWLYCVGVSCELVNKTRLRGGTPTHWVSGGRNCKTGGSAPPGIKICSAQQRRRTPPAFAEWLVSLAESVERKSHSTQLRTGAAVD